MADNFLALIEKRRPDIEKMLAEWITPERFFAMAMQINKNPELASASDDSLVECVVQAAQLGLEIGGPRGHFYVIKYGNAAQGQPGWRGLAFLRLKSGSVMSIDTDVVFKEDRFEIARSSDGDKFTHVLNVMGVERTESNAVGAYAKVILPTGEIQFEWTSRDRIQRHRQHSKQPNGMLWDPKKFWEEGWRKTPFRILDKRLPEGSNKEAFERYAMAISVENANYRTRDIELEIGPATDDNPIATDGTHAPTPRSPRGGVEVVKDPPKEDRALNTAECDELFDYWIENKGKRAQLAPFLKNLMQIDDLAQVKLSEKEVLQSAMANELGVE
jgi:phage RecT family recombinase